jgi:transcription elongation GreA/GreB family factor
MPQTKTPSREAIMAELLSLWQTRHQAADAALHQATEGARSETKSSAGDKYETGRASAHIEQERAAMQLSLAGTALALLARISTAPTGLACAIGSKVETTLGVYFIGPAAGAIQVEGQPVFAVSAASPAGAALLGKKIKDTFTLAGKPCTILSIS